MTAEPLPSGWAPLRRLATEAATEYALALHEVGSPLHLGDSVREETIRAQMLLLANLQRQASRDLWVRELAAKTRLLYGPTAPSWRRAERGDHTWVWALGGLGESVYFTDHPSQGDYLVPGLSALRIDSLALRATLLVWVTA